MSGAPLRAEGGHSVVFLDEGSGFSMDLRPLSTKIPGADFLIGFKNDGDGLTGVKPGALTAVKPDEITGLGASNAGVGASESPFSLTAELSAVDARIAGDSSRRLEGVCCWVFFKGELAGDGVRGPPYSNSSCCCTPGLATRRYSSYGCSHFW